LTGPYNVDISGDITGLEIGKHGVHLRENYDLSSGCDSIAAKGHWNPSEKDHGPPLYDLMSELPASVIEKV